MNLNQDQLNALRGISRIGLIEKQYRWSNKTVPYSLSSGHTDEQNAIILKALRNFEAVSCLKFFNRTNERDYINLMVKQ